MASWMVHLRIADKLLDKMPHLAPVEFIVGNIAPDSGVPNDDWSAFTPSTKISHFKSGKHNKAEPDTFVKKYFRRKQQEEYTDPQYAFYLGYLVHLLTDVAWSENIYYPAKTKFADAYSADPENFIWKLKEDWYDLDYRYLRDHPGFRAFRVYLGAVGFRNDYMEEFSPDAFDNRRKYITDFYLQGKENLDRVYPYLTEKEMDAFVTDCAETIFAELISKYCIPR